MKYKIIKVDSTDDFSFIIKVKPTNSEKHLEEEKCEVITIKGFYDHNRWKKYKRPMSEETHKQSIKLLKKACKSEETILFGVMGNGLIKVKDCLYESRGLFIEHQKAKVIVFSVNDRI